MTAVKSRIALLTNCNEKCEFYCPISDWSNKAKYHYWETCRLGKLNSAMEELAPMDTFFQEDIIEGNSC